MSKHRMVVIDGHIIAQHYKDEGWWTCLLPGQKFAVWEDTRENRFQARSRFGKVPVVECSLKPSAPRSTRFYGEELRQLARSI
jgi:hypothetical protein